MVNKIVDLCERESGGNQRRAFRRAFGRGITDSGTVVRAAAGSKYGNRIFLCGFSRYIFLFQQRRRGMEELMESIRYIYSSANGLNNSEDFYLYLPGAKLAELPEDPVTNMRRKVFPVYACKVCSLIQFRYLKFNADYNKIKSKTL